MLWQWMTYADYVLFLGGVWSNFCFSLKQNLASEYQSSLERFQDVKFLNLKTKNLSEKLIRINFFYARIRGFSKEGLNYM